MDKGKKTQQKQENGDAHAPPKRYTVPPPKDTTRCKSCTYPRVGFICWSIDGSCLRTDMDRIGSKGR